MDPEKSAAANKRKLKKRREQEEAKNLEKVQAKRLLKSIPDLRIKISELTSADSELKKLLEGQIEQLLIKEKEREAINEQTRSFKTFRRAAPLPKDESTKTKYGPGLPPPSPPGILLPFPRKPPLHMMASQRKIKAQREQRALDRTRKANLAKLKAKSAPTEQETKPQAPSWVPSMMPASLKVQRREVAPETLLEVPPVLAKKHKQSIGVEEAPIGAKEAPTELEETPMELESFFKQVKD